MKLVVCEQGSEDWLAARAGACTASRFCDARARLKRASNGRAAGDWAEAAIKYAWLLAHERVAGAPLDDTFSTYAMRRGLELEPFAREAYEARYGVMVEQGGVALTDDGLFGYSTDGAVGEQGGVEIKCPMATDKLGSIWLHPETAEEEYVDQIDGGLWLTGWHWIDLIVYCPWLAAVGKELFVKRIWRNEARIEALETDLIAFNGMRETFEQALRSERPTRYESARGATTPPVTPPPMSREFTNEFNRAFACGAPTF